MFNDTVKRLRSSKAKDSEKANMTDVKMQLPVCPLTLELPTDPVIASDGKVYDLSAWKQYKKSMKTRKKTLVSPVTKQPIKGKVYVAVDIKTMIEDAVKNGHVSDDLCSRWKDKISQEAKFQNMIKDAQKKPELLDLLGDYYNYGIDTPQCSAEAIKYYKKSYEQLQCSESLRKLSILMCLRPEATRTDIINSWATICQLAADNHASSPSTIGHASAMIKLVLSKVTTKLKANLKSGFTYQLNILVDRETPHEEIPEPHTNYAKKQRYKWVKEVACFLKDNGRGTRTDDESDDDDDDEEDDDSELGSEWEEYDPNAL